MPPNSIDGKLKTPLNKSNVEGLVSEHDLTPEDLWFSRNLESLLGSEVAIAKRRNGYKIDRQMLAEWINRNL